MIYRLLCSTETIEKLYYLLVLRKLYMCVSQTYHPFSSMLLDSGLVLVELILAYFTSFWNPLLHKILFTDF